MNVLFVCLGNIFRSQMAEAFFNKYSSNHTSSAGMVSKKYHFAGKKLEEICPLTVQLMREVGIDVSQKLSKQLTRLAVDSADLVVYMADDVHFPGYMQGSYKVRRWLLPDLSDAPDYRRIAPPGSMWTKEKIGSSNYKFLRGVRDMIQTKTKKLAGELGGT